jgi:hypothetical protein
MALLKPETSSDVAYHLQSALFHTEGYKVQSRHFNLIAFAVDVGLLLKALRSAISNEALTLEVKLTQKAVPVPSQTELENKPFLCFTARVGGGRCGLSVVVCDCNPQHP